jgi:hypothetical protein
VGGADQEVGLEGRIIVIADQRHRAVRPAENGLGRGTKRRFAKLHSDFRHRAPSHATRPQRVGAVEGQGKIVGDQHRAHQRKASAQRRNIAYDAVAKRPVQGDFGAFVDLGAPDSSALMHGRIVLQKSCTRPNATETKILIFANQTAAEILALKPASQSGLNIGTGGPSSVSTNTTPTGWPTRSASKSQSTMLVSMVGPSASVT